MSSSSSSSSSSEKGPDGQSRRTDIPCEKEYHAGSREGISEKSDSKGPSQAKANEVSYSHTKY